MRRRTGSRQADLPFKRRGGFRKGAGRKPGLRPWVPRTGRPRLSKHHPVHVTVRLRDSLPALRRIKTDAVIRACFVKARDRFGMRLIDYSIQNNHLHLVIEASDRQSLSRGMQGLLVRIAKGLNKLWERKGSVFADRYHAHVLETPREVRHALAYVINNARKHDQRPANYLDRFSSGVWFDGWKQRVTVRGLDDVATPVSEPRTWLRKRGWRRHGLIHVEELPGKRQRPKERSTDSRRSSRVRQP